MRDCNTVVPELVAYVRRQLTAEALARVEQHLHGCSACQVEAEQLAKVEQLLVECMPSTQISPTLASTFANRLAAEVVAEEAASAGKAQGLLGWLFRPWLIPIVAATALVAIVLSSSLREAPPKGAPATVAKRGETGPVIAGAPASQKEPHKTVAALPHKPGKGEAELVMASPPHDLLERPELFLDYPVISHIDALESADINGSDGAG